MRFAIYRVSTPHALANQTIQELEGQYNHIRFAETFHAPQASSELFPPTAAFTNGIFKCSSENFPKFTLEGRTITFTWQTEGPENQYGWFNTEEHSQAAPQQATPKRSLKYPFAYDFSYVLCKLNEDNNPTPLAIAGTKRKLTELMNQPLDTIRKLLRPVPPYEEAATAASPNP